jgi:hypothetical protein
VSGSIACSSEVNGPDSTTSVDNVPERATTTSTQKFVVRPKTAPAAARPAYSPA